jgi:hypothetical protein
MRSGLFYQKLEPRPDEEHMTIVAAADTALPGNRPRPPWSFGRATALLLTA